MVEPERLQMAMWRRIACWIISLHARTHTRTQTQKCVIRIDFLRNNGFVNAPYCYVIRTLPQIACCVYFVLF